MNELGIKAWKNDHAITVVFPRPSEGIVKKWKLAVQDDIAHIICMPQVDKATVDEIISDLV